MGYTIKSMCELNIPVIIHYKSHTPDAKKKLFALLMPPLEHNTTSQNLRISKQPTTLAVLASRLPLRRLSLRRDAAVQVGAS